MIKKFIHKYTIYLKKPLVFVPLALLIIGGVALAVSGGGSASNTSIVTVTPKEFVQDVAVTGKVVSAEDVALGFDASGRVAKVNVKVGDVVTQGQVLAYIANGDYAASVAQRQAIVASERARLDEVQIGSRPEDLALAQSDVDSAQLAIDQSKRNLVDSIKDAYAKSDDALRTKIDQLYRNPQTETPEITPFSANSVPYVHPATVNSQRIDIGKTLNSWAVSVRRLTTDTYSPTYLTEAKTNVNKMRELLDNLSIVVSNFDTGQGPSAATVERYKTDIYQARTNISAAAASLTAAEQAYTANTSSLKRAQEQLALKKAGSTQQQIDAQAAQLRSAQAQLQSAQALYAKTLITSPINGIVSKVDVMAGEIASPSTPVISLISAANYEVESYISETDIAKIHVGQTVQITLDAYGKTNIFPATVTSVDPAETVFEGVSTYKAKFQFLQNDERIKSGMTANLTIQTDKRDGVIVIPQQAIYLKNGEKMVKVRIGSRDEERVVQTGSINNEGEIEIKSGLSSGDQIIVSTK